MKITKLSLTNFRNYTKRSLDFENDVIVIEGENGTGKTNILEAIHLLSIAKSLRSRYDVDLISHGKEFSIIDSVIQNEADTYKLEIQIKRSQKHNNVSSKKVKVNKLAKRISDFTGIFTSVLFTPEDIEMITKSPSTRRKYMDNVLTQTDSAYKKTLSDYTKAVRQRNKVLEMIREFPAYENQLGYWTNVIIDKGSYIQQMRTHLLENLSKSLKKRLTELEIGKESVDIEYLKSEISNDRIESYARKERAAGRTLIGPHKDDFQVNLDGYDASGFASRGQQRGIILGFKMAEIDYIEEIKGERPVLLLDDIFSELDIKHRQAVLTIIDMQQTFITSAVERDILKPYKSIQL